MIDSSLFADAFQAGSTVSPQDGRPAYPPLMMFRALLIQTLYNLSDEKVEEALADRLAFKRFYGMCQARYLETLKNEFHICLMAVVYNMVRAVNITKNLNLQLT